MVPPVAEASTEDPSERWYPASGGRAPKTRSISPAQTMKWLVGGGLLALVGGWGLSCLAAAGGLSPQPRPVEVQCSQDGGHCGCAASPNGCTQPCVSCCGDGGMASCWANPNPTAR